MRRLLLSTAGVGCIGAAAYKPYYDPIKFSKINEIRDSYDYIVIGAGTTGSVVARRLCEQTNKPSVLLLEAGPPDTFHPFSSQVIPAAFTDNLKGDFDWEFYTEPNKEACLGLVNNRSYWPRGKVCGGSSVLNGMMYVRGHPDDFNQWDYKYGAKGWSYDDVLPYFKKIEDPQFNVNKTNQAFRGSGGPQKISLKQYKNKDNYKATDLFIKACVNKGFEYNEDYNGISQDGVNLTQFNTYKGQRMTSFRSYIAPLFKRWTKKSDYNIDILPYSHVTKILTSKDNNNNKLKADGIELVYNMDVNNKKVIKTSNNGQVILSAGAINTPQILLLSGIGPKDELKSHNIDCVADIAGVGKNLQDHMMSGMRLSVPKDIPLITEKEGLKSMFEYFLNGTGWLTTITTDAQLFCKSSTAKQLGMKTNDLQLVLCPAAEEKKENVEQFKYNINNDCDFANAGIHNNLSDDDKWSILGLVFALNLTSTGSIKLKNNNPFEHPLIDFEYLQTEYDKNCYVDGMLLLRDIFTDKIYRDLGCKLVINKDDYNNDNEYWSRDSVLKRLQKTSLTVYHPVGTCKMGDIDNDIMAVCDERLKVRGFNNLRICDASIMPTLTSGNTQSPCYMIGEKGADMIIKDNITNQ